MNSSGLTSIGKWGFNIVSSAIKICWNESCTNETKIWIQWMNALIKCEKYTPKLIYRSAYSEKLNHNEIKPFGAHQYFAFNKNGNSVTLGAHIIEHTLNWMVQYRVAFIKISHYLFDSIATYRIKVLKIPYSFYSEFSGQIVEKRKLKIPLNWEELRTILFPYNYYIYSNQVKLHF